MDNWPTLGAFHLLNREDSLAQKSTKAAAAILTACNRQSSDPGPLLLQQVLSSIACNKSGGRESQLLVVYNEVVVLQQLVLQQLDTVYKNGVLWPLWRRWLWRRSQLVRVIVSDHQSKSQFDEGAVELVRAEVAAAGYIPTIEEIRAMMAKIPGNMSDDVIRDRGEY